MLAAYLESRRLHRDLGRLVDPLVRFLTHHVIVVQRSMLAAGYQPFKMPDRSHQKADTTYPIRRPAA